MIIIHCTEALILKMAAARFLKKKKNKMNDVSEVETNKMTENTVALINNLSNYTKAIILLRLSEY